MNFNFNLFYLFLSLNPNFNCTENNRVLLKSKNYPPRPKNHIKNHHLSHFKEDKINEQVSKDLLLWVSSSYEAEDDVDEDDAPSKIPTSPSDSDVKDEEKTDSDSEDESTLKLKSFNLNSKFID